MDETRRRALLVINASSRQGKQAQPFIDALEAGGLDLVRRDSPGRERLPELIQSLRNDIDCVVLGGGDGTLSGAAIALRDTRLPLGILPLGTANDLARTLNLPTDPERAAHVILAGRTRTVDVGSVNGRPFFNVASIGLTVEITHRLGSAAKKRLGRLAYAWAAARVVFRHERFSALIRCGSATHRVRTVQITVGNGRFYGGGIAMTQGTQIDDRMLNVYSLEPRTRWSLPFMARAFLAGEHDALPEVRTDRARVVEVVTRLPREVSADGEIVTLTPARFAVLPAAVTIYVPGPGQSTTPGNGHAP